MKKELVAHLNPKSPVSEIFRTLRTNIQFMNSNKRMKTILVTSTFPGEGKSWVASNLAVTFAQAGKRVVLIDADMRKGRLYNVFGVSPRPGLSSYLSGYNENERPGDFSNYIRETEIENLYLIPAGNIPPNPSELLVTKRMRELLNELKRNSDVIIIDATPSILVTDALILARNADTTIIVSAYKETKKDNLEQVIKNIKNVGGNIAGVVLNKIPVSVKKYNETYYYSPSNNSKTKVEYAQNRDRQMARTSDLLLRDRGREESSKTQKQDTKIHQDMDKHNNEGHSTENETQKPSVEETINSTNDIIKQINQYIEEEKKKMN